MNSKKIQTLAAAALAFLLILYVGYQIYLSNHKGIVTETAAYGTVSDTLQARGFALRDEKVITDSYNGVLSYRVADGTRVSNNGVIADVFASESDAAAWNKIDRLDREIASLQALSKPADFFAGNPSTITTQVYTSMGDIFSAIRNGKFSQISPLKENWQTALNRRQLITGEESPEDYQLRIDDLEKQKEDLAVSAGEAVSHITAPAAGYFISSTDGFENVLDISQIEEVTPNQVRDLLGRERGTGLTSSVGKVCSDFKWYILCVFSDSDMTKFEDVTNVNLDIPFASTETIPAKVAVKNRDTATGDTAVVFECSYMDSDIALVRNDMIQVNVQTYSGVLVSERALRFCDVEYTETVGEGDEEHTVTKVAKNVKGVYVQNGRQLEFVQVFTQKTVNGYAICKTELNDEEQAMLVTDSTIQLYDKVVVEGTDLYDGKPIQ